MIASRSLHRTTSGVDLLIDPSATPGAAAADVSSAAPYLPPADTFDGDGAGARVWLRGTFKRAAAAANSGPLLSTLVQELVQEGVVPRLCALLTSHDAGTLLPRDDQLAVDHLTTALRVVVTAAPPYALLFHSALVSEHNRQKKTNTINDDGVSSVGDRARDGGCYTPLLSLLERSEHEKATVNVLMLLCHAARHEAGCCAILAGPARLRSALHTLKDKMRFPRKLAFRRNVVMYRAFAELLVTLNTTSAAMVGRGACYQNARDAGVYQLIVDLCAHDICVAAPVAHKLLESLELAAEHPDTAAHLCHGELRPLHDMVKLCEGVHGGGGGGGHGVIADDGRGDDGALSVFWAAAAVGDGIGGEPRLETTTGVADVDRRRAQMCLGLFSRAFRVLRNLAAHVSVQSSSSARRHSVASLGGIDTTASTIINNQGRRSSGMMGMNVTSGLRRSTTSTSTSSMRGASATSGSQRTGLTYSTSRSGSSSSTSSGGYGGGGGVNHARVTSTSSSFFRDRRLHAAQSSGGIVPVLVTFVLDELQKSSGVGCQYRDFTGESCLEVVADFLFVLSTCHQLRGKALFLELPVITPDVTDRNAFFTALALANDAGGSS